MKAPAAIHGDFTIERTYAAPLAQVFAAWAEPARKGVWFTGPAPRWKVTRRDLDFKVGGLEHLDGVLDGTIETAYLARFHEIIDNQGSRASSTPAWQHRGRPNTVRRER